MKGRVIIPLILLVLTGGELYPKSFKTYKKVHDKTVKAYKGLHKSSVGWKVTGYSNEKNKIYIREFGSGKNTVMIVGGIHGDEPGSTMAVIKFGEYLHRYPSLLTGHVVLIPCLNPDGLMHWSRTNARGVDLNRNFPAMNWTEEYTKSYNNPGRYPASEPETVCAINAIYDYMPWMTIQVHQPFGKIYPSKGIPEELYNVMAVKSGFGIEFDIGYSTPGSIGSLTDIDFLNLPGITFEIGSIYEEPDYCRISLALLEAANYNPD